MYMFLLISKIFLIYCATIVLPWIFMIGFSIDNNKPNKVFTLNSSLGNKLFIGFCILPLFIMVLIMIFLLNI